MGVTRVMNRAFQFDKSFKVEKVTVETAMTLPMSAGATDEEKASAVQTLNNNQAFKCMLAT
jgi:hypothetical protein